MANRGGMSDFRCRSRASFEPHHGETRRDDTSFGSQNQRTADGSRATRQDLSTVETSPYRHGGYSIRRLGSQSPPPGELRLECRTAAQNLPAPFGGGGAAGEHLAATDTISATPPLAQGWSSGRLHSQEPVTFDGARQVLLALDDEPK